MAKKGLGKGLGSLFNDDNPVQIENNIGVTEVAITKIEPNSNQPRKSFDKEKIEALSESIKEHGLIQPIVVTKIDGDRYSIVAGERRWRASKQAGLKTVPVVIRDYSPQAVMEVALIENLQREDLNPIEEALGYRSLLDEFELTQELISQRIGKSRSAVANSLRLLSLDAAIQKLLISGELSSGHARASLSITDETLRTAFIRRVLDGNLNVRQAELLAKQLQTTPKKKETNKTTAYEIQLQSISQTLSSSLGTKVNISHGDKKGKIEIEYYGNDDLSRILELIDK